MNVVLGSGMSVAVARFLTSGMHYACPGCDAHHRYTQLLDFPVGLIQTEQDIEALQLYIAPVRQFLSPKEIGRLPILIRQHFLSRTEPKALKAAA